MNNMKNIVLGMNVGHDGGAAILINGEIKCAISEERLNRVKYSSGYLNSLFYCLKATNTKINEISLFVFSSYGKPLVKNFMGELEPLGIDKSKFITVDHHLSHAYSSYFFSPFEKALILVIDGQGNQKDTESYYIGEGQNIIKIGGNDNEQKIPIGIGRTYEAFTNFIGWTDQEAGKTMGLAAFGKINNIKKKLFSINKNLQIKSFLEDKYEKGAINFMKKNRINFGLPFLKDKSNGSKNAAAYIQRETEDIILKLIKKLVSKTGIKNLCLSGGVALNCNVNSKIIESGLIDNIFIFPAASDKGQCVGNALYGYHKLGYSIPRIILRNDYFGKNYSEKEIIIALKKEFGHKIKKIVPGIEINYKKIKNIAKLGAKLIADGKIIGWFQGGSELGPRALGHRSILCDPRQKKFKKILNDKIKHRESFRPFAPVCLEEEMNNYFETKIPSPFMLFIPRVKKEYRSIIPAVVHKDGTARLQTVNKKDNGIFYDLIKEFYKLTGCPIILNTSFNDNEPIVETPSDAINTFKRTKLDYLIIGNYLVWKKNMQ
jgi:carbamoyltransferase